MNRIEIDEIVDMSKKLERKQRYLFYDTSKDFETPVVHVPSVNKLMKISKLTGQSVNRLSVCRMTILTVKYRGVEFQTKGKEVD